MNSVKDKVINTEKTENGFEVKKVNFKALIVNIALGSCI